MCSAPGARLGGSCMVPWDLSPLADTSRADGAGRNASTSLRSPPAAPPPKLPGPRHRGADPSPACVAANWSQERDEAVRSCRRAVEGWPQSPPGHPLPLIPSPLQSASPWGLVELCHSEETRRWGAGAGTPCCRAWVSPGIRGVTHNQDPRWYHCHPRQANPVKPAHTGMPKPWHHGHWCQPRMWPCGLPAQVQHPERC